MAEWQWLAADAGYGPPAARRTELPHWTYPVEQCLRSRTHLFQQAFAREAIERIGDAFDERVVFDARCDGLQMVGRNEAVLRLAAERIAESYHRRVDIGPARVRLCAGEPVCEPVMIVLVRVPRHLSRAIVRDLGGLGARAIRVEADPVGVTVCAQARQADLMGYHDRVERLAGDRVEVCMHLSHYEPVAAVSDPHAA